MPPTNDPEQFDPYYRWLGIPPKDRPPNHYRMLGLELFEANPEVIRDAVARQMAHVRTYQLGPHSALSQRILNELAAAKVCLSDQEKKAVYDDQLRQRLQPPSPLVDKEETLPAELSAILGQTQTQPRALRAVPHGIKRPTVLAITAGTILATVTLAVTFFFWNDTPPLSPPPSRSAIQGTETIIELPLAKTPIAEPKATNGKLSFGPMDVKAGVTPKVKVESHPDTSLVSSTATTAAPLMALPTRVPGGTTVGLSGGVSLELILVPAGSFTMGDNDGPVSERPAHKVTITKPFYLGAYLVTQEEWQAVMGGNPSSFRGGKNPVDGVSWYDCQKFLDKLNGMVGSGRFSLPTEAQWEYACRAGSNTKYCFGNDEDELGEYAWYGDNSGKKTHAVGKKKPNAWGLYDMHGNVWEWCGDWFGAGYYNQCPPNDPAGPTTGFSRVLRGGCWYNNASICRAAYRGNNEPTYRSQFRGFRVARTQ